MNLNTPRRILVVEDSRLIRHLYRAALEAEGYETLFAEDGDVGVELALRERPDLTLVDVVMPRMDGVAMLQALRAEERARGLHPLRVALLSGMASERLGDLSALQLAATLDKSALTPRELARQVRALLGPLGPTPDPEFTTPTA